MDCFYINLAADTAKRRELESLFEACAPKNWSLHRFEAVDKNDVRRNSIKGSINDGAKGCFLSHKNLIQNNINNTQPLLIIEDDIVFSPKTFVLIENIIQQLDINQQWDIIHTDICIPTAGAMIDFYLSKKNISANQLSLINLQDKVYASTAGYIINSKSLRKVYNLLDNLQSLDQPIDLYYRSLTHSGALNSYATLPFITSLSSRSTQTNIQQDAHAYTELVWHTYRKFIWLDSDRDLVNREIERIEKSEIPKDAEDLLRIVSGVFRRNYQTK
jgi:GR25 family glycosyltransferase involved in LPS biosynthesis